MSEILIDFWKELFSSTGFIRTMISSRPHSGLFTQPSFYTFSGYVNAKFMPGFGNGLRACDVLIMSEISGGGVKESAWILRLFFTKSTTPTCEIHIYEINRICGSYSWKTISAKRPIPSFFDSSSPQLTVI